MRNHPVVIRSTENHSIRPDVIHLVENFLRRPGVSHRGLQSCPDVMCRRRFRPIHAKAFDSSTGCGRPMNRRRKGYGHRHGHRRGSCRHHLHLVRHHRSGRVRTIRLQASPPE